MTSTASCMSPYETFMLNFSEIKPRRYINTLYSESFRRNSELMFNEGSNFNDIFDFHRSRKLKKCRYEIVKGNVVPAESRPSVMKVRKVMEALRKRTGRMVRRRGEGGELERSVRYKYPRQRRLKNLRNLTCPYNLVAQRRRGRSDRERSLLRASRASCRSASWRRQPDRGPFYLQPPPEKPPSSRTHKRVQFDVSQFDKPLFNLKLINSKKSLLQKLHLARKKNKNPSNPTTKKDEFPKLSKTNFHCKLETPNPPKLSKAFNKFASTLNKLKTQFHKLKNKRNEENFIFSNFKIEIDSFLNNPFNETVHQNDNPASTSISGVLTTNISNEYFNLNKKVIDKLNHNESRTDRYIQNLTQRSTLTMTVKTTEQEFSEISETPFKVGKEKNEINDILEPNSLKVKTEKNDGWREDFDFSKGIQEVHDSMKKDSNLNEEPKWSDIRIFDNGLTFKEPSVKVVATKVIRMIIIEHIKFKQNCVVHLRNTNVIKFVVRFHFREGMWENLYRCESFEEALDSSVICNLSQVTKRSHFESESSLRDLSKETFQLFLPEVDMKTVSVQCDLVSRITCEHKKSKKSRLKKAPKKEISFISTRSFLFSRREVVSEDLGASAPLPARRATRTLALIKSALWSASYELHYSSANLQLTTTSLKDEFYTRETRKRSLIKLLLKRDFEDFIRNIWPSELLMDAQVFGGLGHFEHDLFRSLELSGSQDSARKHRTKRSDRSKKKKINIDNFFNKTLKQYKITQETKLDNRSKSVVETILKDSMAPISDCTGNPIHLFGSNGDMIRMVPDKDQYETKKLKKHRKK